MGAKAGTAGVDAVAGLAMLLAVLSLTLAVGTLALGNGTKVARLAGLLAAPAPFLFLTAVGLLNRKRWGQVLGILTFSGMVLANLTTLSVLSVVSVVVSAPLGGCTLYLVFANEEFTSDSGERNVHRIYKP